MLLNANPTKLTEKSEIWTYKLPAPSFSLDSIILNDRYPESGFGQNLECDQLVLVFEGSGEIETRGGVIKITKGNSILIPQMQEYFINPGEDGLMLWVINNPKWDRGQYRVVE